MPEAATIERTAAPPETGAETAQTGAVPGGTEREAQTGQEPNGNTAAIGDDTDADSDEDAEDVDPEEEAIRTKAEALAEEIATKREAERAAKETEERQEREARARAIRSSGRFKEVVSGIEDAVKALDVYDALGNPVAWTPVMLDGVTAAFKAAHLTMESDHKAQLYVPMQDAIKALIPAAEYEGFAKEASETPPEDYFRAAAERIAPTTKWAKELRLADALKLSTKLKADVDEAKRAAIRADRAKPRKAGEPGAGDGQSSSSAKWTTKREARDLHANGKLTDAEMRRIRSDPSIPEGW